MLWASFFGVPGAAPFAMAWARRRLYLYLFMINKVKE